MTEEDSKKSRKNFEEIAKKRIKVGLILNEFGEQNKIKVTEQGSSRLKFKNNLE